MKNIYLIALLGILSSVITAFIILPLLKAKKIGQNIREVGPKSHMKKAGTPTMGGIIFIIPAIILSLIFLPFNIKTVTLLISMVGFGAIGFADDFKKLILKQSEGLTPREKIIYQFALAIIVTVLIYISDKESIMSLEIPFSNYKLPVGVLGFPIMVFVIIGTSNATNLTDGLDGLLASVSIPVFLTLAIIGRRSQEEIFSIIMLTTILGFLFFNSNPASVFMGDTGSMAIGGAIVAMAITMKIPIYLIIFGGIYVLETLSVIIQVTSYKYRNKKRVFLMTPIHHHFELKGYKEAKIVTGFSIVSTIFCIITLAGIL